MLVTAFVAAGLPENECATFEAIADDSFGGLVTQHLFAGLRVPVRELRFSSTEERLTDLKGIILARPNLFLALDSHGPYRVVNSGIARLVKVYEGSVVPIAASSDGSIGVFRSIRMRLPLPRAHIRIKLDDRIDRYPFAQPVREVQERLQQRLEALELATRLFVGN